MDHLTIILYDSTLCLYIEFRDLVVFCGSRSRSNNIIMTLLNRLRYRTYTIENDGDLFLNIDRYRLRETSPMIDLSCYQLLCNASPSVGYGKVYRYAKSQCIP